MKCLFLFLLSLTLSQNVFAKSIEQVRIFWFEQPSVEATISFTTSSKNKAFKVYFDEEKQDGNISSYSNHVGDPTCFTVSGSTAVCHIVMKSLQPSTQYYFVVEAEGEISREFNFVTAPTDQRKFSLLFGGDSRTDRLNRRAMNKRILSLLQNDPKILALVHGGDYITDGSKWSLWDGWLKDHEIIVTEDGRLLPVVPARGNHEVDAELFNKIFNYPGRGHVYYTSHFSSLAIVNLNTEISLSGTQKSWLGQELAKISKESKWIAANYHRPAFPAVKSPGSALQHWVPLFEKYRLDIVFESDGHALKRTVPIRNNRVDYAHGVTYVGEGGLGVKQRSPSKKGQWYFQPPGYAASEHHVQILTVGPEELVFQVILKNGDLYDTFSMASRDRSKEPDPSNSNRIPKAGEEFRLLNPHFNSCLGYSLESQDNQGYQVPCKGSAMENLVWKATDVKDRFMIEHQETELCLTFTDDWLFFSRKKARFLPCSQGSKNQMFYVKNDEYGAFSLKNAEDDRCYRFSSGLRNKDWDLVAYSKKCKKNRTKESFQFILMGTK